MYNLIQLKPPFSGKNDIKLKDDIKIGKYKHIKKKLNYSDDLIDLIEKMINPV
jgi:hypothetical protein